VPPCALGGCEQVLASQYSKIFGIPLALIGAVYYLIVLGLALAYLKLKNNKIILAFFGSYFIWIFVFRIFYFASGFCYWRGLRLLSGFSRDFHDFIYFVVFYGKVYYKRRAS